MIYSKSGVHLDFQFRSIIHGLDIRVKLFWVLMNTGLVLCGRSLICGLCICVVSALLGRIARRPLVQLGLPHRILLLLTAQLMLIQGILHSQGAVIWEAGPVRFHSGGLLLGLQGGINMLAVTTIWLQFADWTTALELRLAFQKFGLPFRMAFPIALGVRFFPIIRADLKSIQESQMTRGVDLDGYFNKIRALPPIILPLIMKAIRRSEAVALAMEMKGFGACPNPSSLAVLKMNGRDWAGLGVAVIFGFAIGIAESIPF